METELPGSGAKNKLSLGLRIKNSEYDFNVMGWSLIIYFLELCVKGILNRIVLIFNIVLKFPFKADCDKSIRNFFLVSLIFVMPYNSYLLRDVLINASNFYLI